MKAYILSDKDYQGGIYSQLYELVSSNLTKKDFQIEHQRNRQGRTSLLQGLFRLLD